MASLNNFDAKKYPNEPQKKGNYTPLPKGKYLACITSSETKQTKAGNGEYLSLTIEVLEGEYKGRKLFETLLLDHPSESAVEIAKKKLSQICYAIGNLTPKESEELHDKPFLVDVGIRNNKISGEPENVIWTYLSEGEARQKKTVQLKKTPLHANLPKQVDSEGDVLPSSFDDEIPF